MDLLLDPSHWAILAVIGILAGFIDAIVGGGGLLSIPALLTVGIPPHLALGTNKLAACFGSLTSSYTFYKQHLFNPALWKACFFATLVGSIAGCGLVFLIDPLWLDKNTTTTDH